MTYGTLKPEGYRPRACDEVLRELLGEFGAVEVAGTMWCGKTWTSLSVAESVTRVGNPGVRRTVESDPSVALLGNRPHVIDEWQDVPEIWDAVRDSVDAEAGVRGSYVLTGSSSPRKERVSHSGAGRIARVRMRTMSLQETGESTGAVSLRGLFEGNFEPQLVQQGLEPLSRIVCRGGWPAIVGPDVPPSPHYLDSYFDAIFGVSVPRRGLDGADSRRVALSLARNLGTAAKYETIGTDAFPDLTPDVAKRRANEHIALLEDLYVIEQLRGWDAPIRSKSRLRTKPKRYFADPSLAASLLQVNPGRLLEDGQLFGLLFESLCIHDLAVYASVLPGAGPESLHYYRDADGLEVDAIVELRDGRWAGFEVKLGESGVEAGARSLNRLRRKVAANPAARNPEPSFMAVIVGSGEFARHDVEKDVYVIPLTSLGV